jgi:hypothetical protein
MPYTIRKVRNKNCYRNMNKKTRKVIAKCSTREKALSQLRLLHAIKFNKNFVLRKPKMTGSRSIKRKAK